MSFDDRAGRLRTEKTEILIVGSGAAGLFCALNLPEERKVTVITKGDAEESDSFLAQGGICVLRDEEDNDSYYEDTMRAGHYENDPDSVEVMIRSSQDVIRDLISYGVDFEKKDGELCYTREGAHSRNRILFHEDITGKEITSKLLARVREKKNVEIREYCTMLDYICKDGQCFGIVLMDREGNKSILEADYTVLACGGIGGLFEHSTNFPHLTGDALAISLRHGVELKNINYIQIHPTTLYTEKKERSFLISESVRGEGAVLYNKNMERFVDELLPRDVVTKAIREQMAKDDMPYAWLSMEHIPEEMIKSHFPNIYQRCLEEGYDVTKECIPVVPAQHYFMGGIKVNLMSRTSMGRLYAIGETSCNGVHGANRLASNSLLESLVFAKRAAKDIVSDYQPTKEFEPEIDMDLYEQPWKLAEEYKKMVLDEIERMENQGE